jgi:2,5-diamino-6-(ribosylamino)-4(3H)-pyrimidinone 5'-phosphate reductase
VDLGGALRLLAQRHQVGAVRVDAGGGLNGALLQAGLADQVSIVIAPYLAATATAGPVPLIADPGCPMPWRWNWPLWSACARARVVAVRRAR